MSAPSQGYDVTAAYPALSIYALRKAGRLWPGLSTTWTWRCNGRVVDSAVIQADEDQLVIDGWRSIPLTRTGCHFGGERVWFSCPGCSRRAAILYRGDGGEFACRQCLRLNYKSQRESRTDRMVRRAEKTRQKLAWPPGIASDCPGKPPNMTWKRYQALVAEHDALADGAMGIWTNSLQQRLQSRSTRR